MSENQRLRRVCAMLLHRLGGHVHLVRGDWQATEGKWVAAVGKLGQSVVLELRERGDERPMRVPEDDDGSEAPERKG